MFRLHAKYLGKSVNDITPDDIKTIEAMMIKQKPFIKKYHEDDGQDLLLKGDVDVVLEYNGRSEEHTSELQSLMRNSYAVFCLKKKNEYNTVNNLTIRN